MGQMMNQWKILDEELSKNLGDIDINRLSPIIKDIFLHDTELATRIKSALNEYKRDIANTILEERQLLMDFDNGTEE